MEPGSGYSRPWGPFLPRPPETFTQGAFGPFSPILPVPVDQPPPGFDRAQPRRWQPPVGYNLPVGAPGNEGFKLASFQTLKTLSETYSILRTCLERRKNEIRALDWDITLTPDAAKAYQGDRKAMRDFGERRAKALKFFRRPDSDYDDFGSWLHALTDQLFVYDAVSVWMCPKKGRGLRRGLLGSDLDELWLLDGSAIRPLAGLHGERPKPPAPGFQQYEFGVPRADLTTIVAGLDLDGSEGRLSAELRGDQLTYRPYLRRADSPYGFSVVEQCLIPIMTGLRRQAYQLDYFDESTVPRVYISPGDSTLTANQLRELQDALNATAGDLAWAFKIQVLPPGSKVMPQKEMEIVSDADNWIATEVAMACDISPVEIGLLPKVSAAASPFAAREMAQASRSIHERTATKPTLSYLAAIPDMILQVVCGQDDMRFVFSGMEQTQDAAALTDMGIKQVQSGVRSIDEVRDDLHLPPWGLPETSGPIVITQMGPLPLGQAASDTVSQLRQAITGAHDSAQGHQSVSGSSPRKMLPAGTSGTGRMNGPVTQRQARRGGALAPAHATAEGAPGHSGGKPAPKAAAAELEALGRHLRKGMPAAEWVPEHIPGAVMAMISEDLGKGLSAGYVISQAIASLGKAPAPQQQSQSQQRRQMAALSAQYQAQVQAAFASALSSAQGLVAAWIAGTLAVTAAVLASMIAELVRKALLAVLTELWTAAWDAGSETAGGKPSQAELEAFLATEGRHWAELISGTGSAALVAAIRLAIAAGDPAVVMERLAEILRTESRSEMIAVSEVTRGWNAGFLCGLQTGYKTWRNREDGNVCPACIARTALGSVPAGFVYPGNVVAPPGHPFCRCWLVRSAPPQAGKVLRREVGLNGQETWTDWTPEPETTGGRVFQPHVADGTQVPQGGVPGASAGGEPPRWDGSEPDPVVERAPDADDDAEYGSATGIGARPGAYWPAPYMDGWWPSPAGHGTGQPPASSPGAANGRPPNAAGKASKDAAARFLQGAPKANPAAVRAVMRKNFPSPALRWVAKIRWAGPVDIPLSLIDASSEKDWAASHEQAHVDQIAADLEAGKEVNPVIGIVRPGHAHIRMIDGRHRYRAAAKLGRPVRGYVGFVTDALLDQALDTYHEQRHSGSSPENKSFTAGAHGDGSAHGLTPFNLLAGPGRRDESSLPGPPFGAPYCAGLVLRAADTGRVLMLQRSSAEPDDGAGLLEWPGGHAEPGEALLAAAMRELTEEVGLKVPAGHLSGHWESSNGVYAGFILNVLREADVDLGARDLSSNPDGDEFTGVIWIDPAHLGGNRAVREEVRADLPLVLAALQGGAAKSAKTSAEVLREYWTHEGHPGPTQYALEQKIRWGEKDDWYRCVDQLTPYIGDGAKGYCTLRHHEVLGVWPGHPV